MSEPKPSTIKRLFALSRNVCAFPQCDLPIVEDSGTVTGIVCHIKARSRGGPRYYSKQTDEERHSFENLILLCSRHSKVIDSDPKKFDVELLQEIKVIHEQKGNIELSKAESEQAMKVLESYRLIYIAPGSEVNIRRADTIHAKTVNVGKSGKSPNIQPPPGAIASSLAHRNYAKHLVDRYHEFASDLLNDLHPHLEDILNFGEKGLFEQEHIPVAEVWAALAPFTSQHTSEIRI